MMGNARRIRSPQEIAHISHAGAVVAACHRELRRQLRPGATTDQINRFVERYLQRNGARAAQKGYKGYPYAICASVNDTACHGFPDSRPLRRGDIVTIDMVAELNGWMADSAWTYAVGKPEPADAMLMHIAKQALYAGIRAAKAGHYVGDIGAAVERCAQQGGMRVIPDFIGHGIGRAIHEKPEVYHTGAQGRGERLEEGMVITVEPILTAGGAETFTHGDGWTVTTLDGSRTAQYEHTIAITSGLPRILTRQE